MQCYEPYGLTKEGGCGKCSDECYRCDGDSKKCLECGRGTGLTKDGKCVSCPSDCAKCNGDTRKCTEVGLCRELMRCRLPQHTPRLTHGSPLNAAVLHFQWVLLRSYSRWRMLNLPKGLQSVQR